MNIESLHLKPHVEGEHGIRILRDRRGWYARVTQGGAVAVSDAVTVEKADE